MSQTTDKQVHLILRGEQVKELEMLRSYTGITNDNDLFRYLLRQAVRELRAHERGLLQSA
jgi:hypothetical protein